MKPASSALVALTALNFLNYLDRFVVAGMVEPLKRQFDASDAQIGLLTSAFLVAYLVMSPLFGIAARTMRRTALLGGGVFAWSLATAAAAFTGSFGTLVATRAVVGVGEAAYATIGPSILGDWFAPERRSAVLAIFYAAIPVGSAAGFLVGGLVSESLGWRAAFLWAGVPGMVLALLCWRMTEPARGSMDPPVHDASPDAVGRRGWWRLASNPEFMWAVLGYAAFTFALGALAVWMPAFLQRERGWSVESSSLMFGGIVLTTGFLGTILGGALDARVARGRAAPSLRICAVSALIAGPLVMLAIVVDDARLCVVATSLGCLAAFASQAPINAVILNSVDAGARAFAVGMSTMIVHALGDVPSPWLVGAVSDGTGSLTQGLVLVPAGFAVAALVWGLGAIATQPGAQRSLG